MLIGWGVSGIFTACGLLEGNDLARTDIGHDAIADANWFYFPYPGITRNSPVIYSRTVKERNYCRQKD